MKGNNLEENMAYLERDIDILVNNIINSPQLTATAIGANKQPLLLKLYAILSDFEKVLEENEELKKLANNKQWISPCYVAQNYIPKSRVIEKIEELKSKSGGNVFHIQQTINAEIRLLQELLERKEK